MQSIAEIGLVIPIYQTNFIKNIIYKLMDSVSLNKYSICIVNDGRPEVASYLSQIDWPENVFVLNLSENRAFAGANNAGWKYLIEKFPSIKYLGTINDDTIPYKGWLDPLVRALENYPKTAIAAPVMETEEGWFRIKKLYAKWELKNADVPLLASKGAIKCDTFVPAVSGYCFLARRDVLEDVNFFDERYRNSCEDIDLCLKFRLKKWRIVVCSSSTVFHYGGQTRYLKNTSTDIIGSHKKLAGKWGGDLTPFNRVRPKTVAHCVAFNQEHFIAPWVKNVAEYADEIVVLYSKKPWNYNISAKYLIKPDATGEILEDLKKEYPKLVVVQGEWPNETVQRNDGIKIAKNHGAEWFLVVDTDEFFEPKEIFEAYEWMLNNPSELWLLHHIQLIKQIGWSIVTSGGNPKFQFAIDITKVKTFFDKRTPDTKISETIPENICKCWHFSYLMPDIKVKEKLASFGHAQEIHPDWLTEVWPNIKPDIKDFHPVLPEGWKGIKEVEVPSNIVNLIPWL